MELKFLSVSLALRSSSCFNCTFMELKYASAEKANAAAVGFNCTFMELKFCKIFFQAREALF